MSSCFLGWMSNRSKRPHEGIQVRYGVCNEGHSRVVLLFFLLSGFSAKRVCLEWVCFAECNNCLGGLSSSTDLRAAPWLLYWRDNDLIAHTHTNRMEILHSRQHLEDISVTRHHYAFPSLASFITRATCLSLSKKRREAGGKPERREEQQRGEASHVERITDRDAKWRKTRATSSVLQYKFNVVVLYCRILTWWHLTLLLDNTSSHFFLCSENHATPNLVIFISIH